MILEHLKEKTKAIHDEVEEDNLTGFIMDGSINQAQYEELLRQNFSVYKAVEDFINARYDNLPDELKPFAGYQKTNALAKDIAGFSNFPLPQPTAITGPRDLGTLVGALYVIEGSMMGGMMMSKKLQSCEKLEHIEAHYFYNTDTKVAATRWKSFKEAVLSCKFTSEDIDKAGVSAIHIFEHFKKAYKKPTM